MERESTGYDVRLNHLDLTNYRGFSQLSHLEFGDRVTVLISENGGGKTSILDAIANALKIFVSQLIRAEFIQMPAHEPKNIKNGTRNGSIQLAIDGKMSFIDKVGEEYVSEGGISGMIDHEGFDSLLFTKKLQISLNEKVTISRIDEFEVKTDSEFDFGENFKKHYREELDYLPILVYYGCNSINTTADTSDYIREGKFYHLYAKSLEANRFSFQSFLRWFDTEYKINYISKRDFVEMFSPIELIRDVVETILNDETDKVFENLRMEYSIAGDTLVIDKKNSIGGKDMIEVAQMSAGEKVMLALTADIAKRLILANPDLAQPDTGYTLNPLHGRGIVLIDEIDLHLHPKWQRQILPKLIKLFPNVQFVVTTHSPFVLQSVKPEEALIVKLVNGTVQLIENPFHYGRDASAIAYDLQGVCRRIPEVSDQIKKMYQLIDDNNYQGAKKCIDELAEFLSDFDEDIIKATTFLQFLDHHDQDH